jgi:hypothetical protein
MNPQSEACFRISRRDILVDDQFPPTGLKESSRNQTHMVTHLNAHGCETPQVDIHALGRLAGSDSAKQAEQPCELTHLTHFSWVFLPRASPPESICV